jgi:exodeoxyribonuclease-5
MNGIILNEQQERIKNEAIHWFLYESKQVFEIAGPAGTGKSVLIGQILRELQLEINQVAPMSYTGQASIVMRTRGFPNARSIHSTLYEVVETDQENDILAARFGAKGKKKEFVLRKFIDPAIRLFFIDEAWMVPDSMVREILSFGIKVIAAGDQFQLPPINANPGFLTGYGVHYLTQLMRQSESDPIVYLANRAKNGEPIHCGSYGNGYTNVLVINEEDIIPQMMGFSDVILCGTNRTREIMNGYIRHLAGFEGNIPKYGERIICRKNNWEMSVDGISLANGLSGTVVNNPDPASFDGQVFKVNFKPDLTDRVFYDVPINYKFFIAPFDEKNGLKSSFEAKWLLGELFDYAYALTTHLAQGSEYNNCLYIEEFMRYDIQNQLNYTGITRAKQFLIYAKKKRRNLTFVNNPIQ